MTYRWSQMRENNQTKILRLILEDSEISRVLYFLKINLIPVCSHTETKTHLLFAKQNVIFIILAIDF